MISNQVNTKPILSSNCVSGPVISGKDTKKGKNSHALKALTVQWNYGQEVWIMCVHTATTTPNHYSKNAY